MDWYLRQPENISIIVEQHLVAIVFEGQPDLSSLDGYVEKAQYVVRSIEKCSAFEKKAEPLFPRLEDSRKGE